MPVIERDFRSHDQTDETDYKRQLRVEGPPCPVACRTVRRYRTFPLGTGRFDPKPSLVAGDRDSKKCVVPVVARQRAEGVRPVLFALRLGPSQLRRRLRFLQHHGFGFKAVAAGRRWRLAGACPGLGGDRKSAHRRSHDEHCGCPAPLDWLWVTRSGRVRRVRREPP